MSLMQPSPSTGQFQNSLEAQQLAGSMGLSGVYGQPSATDGMVYLGPNYDKTQGVPT